MSLYKLNNVEVEIDLEDADFLRRYENAFNKMQEKETELQKVGMNSQFIFNYCELFYGLFDDIFGEGKGEEIFKGKHNARLVDEVYAEFINICTDQGKEATERRNKLFAKYQPSHHGTLNAMR